MSTVVDFPTWRIVHDFPLASAKFRSGDVVSVTGHSWANRKQRFSDSARRPTAAVSGKGFTSARALLSTQHTHQHLGWLTVLTAALSSTQPLPLRFTRFIAPLPVFEIRPLHLTRKFSRCSRFHPREFEFWRLVHWFEAVSFTVVNPSEGIWILAPGALVRWLSQCEGRHGWFMESTGDKGAVGETKEVDVEWGQFAALQHLCRELRAFSWLTPAAGSSKTSPTTPTIIKSY